MRIWLATMLASGLFLGGLRAVSAADTPAPDWSGVYLGVNLGYVDGRSDAVTTTQCGTFNPFYFNCGNLGVVQASGTGAMLPTSMTAGIQGGSTWQTGRWVYGAELDFGALDLKGSRAGTSAYLAVVPGVPFTTRSSIGAHWLFTSRARLGWAATPDTLIYGTGGLALTSIKIANAFNDSNFGFSPGSGAGSNSVTKAGWTLGGGIEWMLSSKWTVKAEYLHVEFGSVPSSLSVTCPGAGCAGASSVLTTAADLTAHIVRVGLNYRFDN